MDKVWKKLHEDLISPQKHYYHLLSKIHFKSHAYNVKHWCIVFFYLLWFLCCRGDDVQLAFLLFPSPRLGVRVLISEVDYDILWPIAIPPDTMYSYPDKLWSMMCTQYFKKKRNKHTKWKKRKKIKINKRIKIKNQLTVVIFMANWTIHYLYSMS